MSDALQAYVKAQALAELVDWTVGDLLRDTASAVPDREAIVWITDEPAPPRDSWTYRELLSASESIAEYLLKNFAPGEHIALWATNRPEWLMLQFGAALAGLVLVTVNPAARDADLTHIVKQSDAVALFHGVSIEEGERARLLARVREVAPKLRLVETLDDAVARSAGLRLSRPLPAIDPQSPAMILFTSGTTGKAKGSLLSHFALVNGQRLYERKLGLDEGSIWLNPTPLYTISGSIFVNLGALWNRGTHLLLARFHPRLAVRGIQEKRANWAALVPTMATMLLEYVENDPCDFSSFKAMTLGGSPIAPELSARLEQLTGADYCGSYGQTEAGSIVTHGDRDDPLDLRAASAGKILPGREIRISDPDTGKTKNIGETGEICIRGMVMSGYYGMPEATEAALKDGWLHTGDLGELNKAGYLTISGRLKDMIIRGGLNIYPREIEDILIEHPAIVEAAVFGVSDERWGEVVIAAVRLREKASLVDGELKEFLALRIAENKIPSRFYVVERFPLTVSGKIQKFALREAYVQANT